MLAEKALFEAWRKAARELEDIRGFVCAQLATRHGPSHARLEELRKAEAVETAAKRVYDKAFPDNPISRLHGRPMKKGER